MQTLHLLASIDFVFDKTILIDQSISQAIGWWNCDFTIA